MVEGCKNKPKVIRVYWKASPHHIFKLNTDGSALENPEKIGGSGILKDLVGDMIYAFVTPLGVRTNNQAVIQSAVFEI